jgi:outer membrane protein TolC
MAIFLIYPASSGTAQPLMSLYRASVLHFPAVQSFQYKEQALRNENTALGWQRFVDIDVIANYSRLSTKNLGKYSGGELGLVNNFDIFNKRGLDKAINRYEIRKNRSLTDAEKKSLFNRVTEAYYRFLKYTLLLEIHRENLDQVEKNIHLADTGVEKGAFPATEITRWTIEKFNRQNSIKSDSLEINRAEDILRALTGLTEFTLADTTGMEYVEITEGELLAHSPELTVFDLEKKQAELEIRKEYRDQFPDLQVGNSLVMNHEPESPGDYYMVSANLNFKLFDGGRKYRINAIHSRILSIESDRAAAEALLTADYRSMLKETQTRKAMLINLESMRRLSSENLNKLVAGYQKRYIDFNTLYTAYRENLILREDYVNSYIEYNQSYQYLYHLSRGDIYQ